MKLDHVHLMIPEGGEDEARGYYAELLGMTPVARPAGLPSPRGLWFAVEGGQVHLGVQKSPPDPTARSHAAFVVADLGAVRARLLGADFEVIESNAVEERPRFHTRDPFGNRLEFIQETKT